MKNRAARRHHLERLRSRWAKLLRWLWFYGTRPLTPQEQASFERQVYLHLKTRQLCSCAMCRNARRNDGPGRQERVDQLVCREQLQEISNYTYQ